MNDYVSDKEQIEMLKNWWKENGKFTLLSIAMVLLVSACWRYWQNMKAEDAASASLTYEQMLIHESSHQYSEVEFDVTSLLANHAGTPYAPLGAFISAQNAINDNKLEEAVQRYDWVIAHAKSQDFKNIASIRKARILLSLKKYEEALQSLSAIHSKPYLPLVNEVRGDIYAQQGNKAAALNAYQTAVNNLRKDAPNHSFLEMKYNELKS